MIEKVKLNEVAKDLNISGKDLTALLQQRFGGEAKKAADGALRRGAQFCDGALHPAARRQGLWRVL